MGHWYRVNRCQPSQNVQIIWNIYPLKQLPLLFPYFKIHNSINNKYCFILFSFCSSIKYYFTNSWNHANLVSLVHFVLHISFKILQFIMNGKIFASIIEWYSSSGIPFKYSINCQIHHILFTQTLIFSHFDVL